MNKVKKKKPPRESLLISTQIMTYELIMRKQKLIKYNNSMYRLYGDTYENVDQITECSKLAQRNVRQGTTGWEK